VDKVNISIKLKRIFTPHITSTFIPTSCLTIIAELTLFIDESHIEATIMVALTTMLVMYTLFQNVSDTLPHTAYLKMIDIWLFAGLILPFFVFICLMAIEKSLNGKKKEKQQDAGKIQPIEFTLNNRRVFYQIPVTQEPRNRTKLLAQIVIPLLTLVFLVTWWIIAVVHYLADF